MKKERHTEEQIAFGLRQQESGTPAAEIIRKMGIAERTFYLWKKKYAGLGEAAPTQNPTVFSQRPPPTQGGLST